MASNTAPKQSKTKANQPAAREKAVCVAVPGRRRVDWDAVERDYRTGKFTLRELEEKHGVFNSSIARKAKKDGWTQDLRIAIRQATNAKLAGDLVSNLVSEGAQNVSNAVLAAAEVNTRVILSHRKGLQAITNVKRTLLNQIEQAAANMADLAEIIEMVRSPDDHGIDRANDALRKAMSRSALVDDLKKLADVDEKVRKGEREAFGLDDDGKPDRNGLEEAATAELQALRARLMIEQ
jgi:hypothetical protein